MYIYIYACVYVYEFMHRYVYTHMHINTHTIYSIHMVTGTDVPSTVIVAHTCAEDRALWISARVLGTCLSEELSWHL